MLHSSLHDYKPRSIFGVSPNASRNLILTMACSMLSFLFFFFFFFYTFLSFLIKKPPLERSTKNNHAGTLCIESDMDTFQQTVYVVLALCWFCVSTAWTKARTRTRTRTRTRKTHIADIARVWSDLTAAKDWSFLSLYTLTCAIPVMSLHHQKGGQSPIVWSEEDADVQAEGGDCRR